MGGLLLGGLLVWGQAPQPALPVLPPLAECQQQFPAVNTASSTPPPPQAAPAPVPQATVGPLTGQAPAYEPEDPEGATIDVPAPLVLPPERKLPQPPPRLQMLPPPQPSSMHSPPPREDAAIPRALIAPTPGVSEPAASASGRLDAIRTLPSSDPFPPPVPSIQMDVDQLVRQVVEPQRTLTIYAGQSKMLVLARSPNKLQVGDEQIAAADLQGPTQLSVKARNTGTTVLNLWFANPADGFREQILCYLVRVLPDPTVGRSHQALADQINQVFPQCHVTVTQSGDKMTVCGQAHDITEAIQILRAVRAHADKEIGHPSGAGHETAANSEATAATPDSNERGKLPLAELAEAGGPNVINLLRVSGEQRLTLKVMLATVNRSAAQSIGLQLNPTNPVVSPVFQTAEPRAGSLLDNGQIRMALRALAPLNLAQSLSEPDLATRSGHPVNFRAGGQIVVPLGAGSTPGTRSARLLPFDLDLTFLPVVSSDRDRVRLNIQGRVDTRDLSRGPQGGVKEGPSPSPTGNERSFAAQVELHEGQTVTLTGLIPNHLVSSAKEEVILLVTPELASPLQDKEGEARNRTDTGGQRSDPSLDLVGPADLEFYLLQGRNSSNSERGARSPDEKAAPGSELPGPSLADPVKMLRYSRCEEALICGPHGCRKKEVTGH